MRILIVNQTFPGALGILAGALATSHQVFFAAEDGRAKASIRGVKRIVLTMPHTRPEGKPALPVLDTAEREGRDFIGMERALIEAFAPLRRPDTQPDIVITAGTPGMTLALRAIFPDAFLVCYAEWYYSSRYFSRIRPLAPGDVPSARAILRNAYQAYALAECNLAFTATRWQKMQYPPALARNINVFHRCVDTEAYRPLQAGEARAEILKDAAEVVTVTGRGMESTAEFGHIIAALSLALENRPGLHVTLLARLEDVAGPKYAAFLENPRVHVMRFVSDEEYLSLLRSSTLYLYPNDSNMLSSGIFEAMSCGLTVMATNRGAVAEIVRDGDNAFLFSLKSSCEEIAAQIGDLLDRSPTLGEVRAKARQTIIDDFSLKAEMPRHLSRILKGCEAWKQRLAAEREALVQPKA